MTLMPKCSGTFYFYHLGCLSRTSSSWVFCNAGEVQESTRYKRGPLQLSFID